MGHRIATFWSARSLRTILVGACLLIGTQSAEAALVLAYDTGSNPAGSLAASETGLLVTAQNLTRGAGLNTGPGNSSFNSNGFDTSNASFADAIADNELLTWGWTAAPLTDLGHAEVRYDRSNTGPSQMRIDLAINGGAFQTIYSDTAVSTTGTDALNINLSAYTNVTSAIFRLVMFGASNTNGTFDIENYQAGPSRGIAVFSAPVSVPEPASLAMIGLFAVPLVLRRRRTADVRV